jgi:hypothetical protein
LKKKTLSHFFAGTILMVRPASFNFNAETSETNSFQQAGIQAFNARDKAVAEFDAMVQLLIKSGIDVRVMQDQSIPGKPDAIFPNNWFSTHQAQQLVLYPMFAENRRLEREPHIITYLKSSFTIREIIDLTHHEQHGKYLEGTGSIVFDHKNRIAYGCKSPRTSAGLLENLSIQLGYEPFLFEAFDGLGKPVYHTNVVMCFIPGKVIICMESLREEDQVKLALKMKSLSMELVSITRGQMENFAGNMLCLKNGAGNYFLILSERAFNSLQPNQIESMKKVCELLVVNIPVIETVGGGGARCMIAEIFLTPA